MVSGVKEELIFTIRSIGLYENITIVFSTILFQQVNAQTVFTVDYTSQADVKLLEVKYEESGWLNQQY